MNYKIITVQDHFVRNQVLVMRSIGILGTVVRVLAIHEDMEKQEMKELAKSYNFGSTEKALAFIDSFGIKEAVQFLDSFKQINIIDYQLITSYFTNFKTLAWFFRLTTISLIHQLRITAPAEPGI